mmetsp:Transcript_55037/g.61496  ORF Transcript_55037/g.61496 Transcript_55037/m.61496 type:complete len:130 (+) Transcript_55037:27-416(+)
MIPLHLPRYLLLSLLCVLLISIVRIESFQVVPKVMRPCKKTTCTFPKQLQRLPLSYSSSSLSSPSMTVMDAKKKKMSPSVEEGEEEKSSGLGLIFTYMTPWKNPNSIFVYLFLSVFLLGKYSESHPPAW